MPVTLSVHFPFSRKTTMGADKVAVGVGVTVVVVVVVFGGAVSVAAGLVWWCVKNNKWAFPCFLLFLFDSLLSIFYINVIIKTDTKQI